MSETPGLPQPDPELKRLDCFVGRWSMEGHLVGSDEKNINRQTTFRWLPDGFFYSNLSPAPLPYRLEIEGDAVTIR